MPNREVHFGVKAKRSWQEAVVRYLSVKAKMRSIHGIRASLRRLDDYLGGLTLDQINGDVIWTVISGETKKGLAPASVNRYSLLCTFTWSFALEFRLYQGRMSEP